jgi:hypothetical protein
VLMRPEIIQNLHSGSDYLDKLKRVGRVASLDSGLPEKPKCLPKLIKKPAAATKTDRFEYRPKEDGNVFEWIIYSAKVRRHLRRIEQNASEEAAAKLKRLDQTKVED